MTQEHLDADVVAAWADGSLDPRARAAAEAHAADCTRCQAVLAAMVRTDTEAVQPTPGWLSAHVRWLVPLVTAAAAVILWVALSMDVLAPAPSPQVLRQKEAAAPEASEAPAPVTRAPVAPAQPMEAAKRREEADATSTRQRAAAGRAEPFASGEPQRRSDKPAAIAETVVIDDLRRDALARRPPATPPSAAPSAPASAAAVPPPPPSAKPEAAAEPAQLRAMTSVTSQSPALSALREFASPDVSTRWRVGPGGAIHRSVDAGKTWAPQASGVSSELVAASAPATDICWVVGRTGVVLLSTDGSTWRRVTFPEPVDLRGVTAADGRTASVTTIDGRIFRTTDGGGTWRH